MVSLAAAALCSHSTHLLTDLFTDKPDHVILSIPSILRIFSGEQQQLPPSYKKPNRTSIDTLTYCLWLACRRSLALFSFTEDREEEEAVKEERECYTMQLFVRIVQYWDDRGLTRVDGRSRHVHSRTTPITRRHARPC